jgi:hypothetical protein
VDFDDRMSAAQKRSRLELDGLRNWYNEARSCANAGFADYFKTGPDLQAEHPACTTAQCRCSTCWAAADDLTPTPPLLAALNTPRPRPSILRDAAPYQTAMDQYVRALLWDNYRGLTAGMIHRILRGDETYVSQKDGRRRLLWPGLLYHRLRGVDPGARLDHVTAALTRLADRGAIESDSAGRIWRLRHQATSGETSP